MFRQLIARPFEKEKQKAEPGTTPPSEKEARTKLPHGDTSRWQQDLSKSVSLQPGRLDETHVNEACDFEVRMAQRIGPTMTLEYVRVKCSRPQFVQLSLSLCVWVPLAEPHPLSFH